MALEWKKGSKGREPNPDAEEIKRVFSDPLQIPGEFLTWLKHRLELEDGKTQDCCGNTVNPYDIEVPRQYLECMNITAGVRSYAQFTVAASVFRTTQNTTTPEASFGPIANSLAGFSLQIRYVTTATLSSLANMHVLNVELELDTTPADGTGDGAMSGGISFPESGYVWPTVLLDSGWKTALTPAQGALAAYSNICDGIVASTGAFTNNLGFGSVVPAFDLYWRWVYDPDSLLDDFDADGLSDLGTPTDPSIENIVRWNPSTYRWEIDSDFLGVARGRYRANSGGTSYERQRLNVIPGSSKLSVAMADDTANEEVDLTLDVVPANIAITGLGSFPGGTSTFLRADATFADPNVTEKGRLTAYFNGTPVAGTTRYVVVPRGKSDADSSIDLERLHFRLDVPASAGTTTAILQRSAGGVAPSWVDVATISITAGNYEATDETIGAHTVTTDDLLRLYFTAVGTGADGYTAIATGTEV